jgi:hypothetical protein
VGNRSLNAHFKKCFNAAVGVSTPRAAVAGCSPMRLHDLFIPVDKEGSTAKGVSDLPLSFIQWTKQWLEVLSPYPCFSSFGRNYMSFCTTVDVVQTA